jgi:hypothetical protein
MKIAICVPVYDAPKFEFFVSYSRMMSRLAAREERIETRLFASGGVDTTSARVDIAERAMEWEPGLLLWLDADQTFPDDALERLRSHKTPIVGANYVMRSDPKRPVAVRDGRPVVTTNEKAESGLLEAVDHTGFGVLLIDAEVFRKIEKPWFNVERDGTGRVSCSEDAWFFRQARGAEFQPYVDHALSWRTGHVSRQILTNASAARSNITKLRIKTV